jgi:hypothetical protein
MSAKIKPRKRLMILFTVGAYMALIVTGIVGLIQCARALLRKSR